MRPLSVNSCFEGSHVSCAKVIVEPTNVTTSKAEHILIEGLLVQLTSRPPHYSTLACSFTPSLKLDQNVQVHELLILSQIGKPHAAALRSAGGLCRSQRE